MTHFITDKPLYIFIAALTVMLLAVSIPIHGQTSVAGCNISGTVRDSVSLEPVPYAAIYLKGSNTGTMTDENGTFVLNSAQLPATLRISSMGFAPKEQYVPNIHSLPVQIEISPVGVSLDEVTVRRTKEHYSKRNNPAVKFVERIMAARDITDPKRNDNYNYREYERISLALNDFTPADSAKSNTIGRKFAFLKEYTDTSEISGKPILTFSVKEKISDHHYRRTPPGERDVIQALRRTGLDDITDQESMHTFLADIFRDIDLYQNDITLLQNRFVSPLGRIATDFYKFYLTDTIPDISAPGDSLIELSFAPHNPQSFGFLGRIYVSSNDSTMFIKRVKMTLPRDINVNFIDRLYMTQEYERAADGSRLKTKDDMVAEITLIPGTQPFYGRRSTVYSDHNFDIASATGVFDIRHKTIVDPAAYVRNSEYWNKHRPIPMTSGESGIAQMIQRMRSVPIYYWTEKVIQVLVSGYLPTGPKSKWDFGPMNTTISFNDMEGVRLRAGGTTTAELNNRWFGRGYVARGFKDHKWKYSAEAEYSFIDKKSHSREFPVQSLRLTHLYDVDMIGQHYLFTNPDNVFLSLKRQPDTQMTYHRLTKLEYTLELENNFTFYTKLAHERQEATAYMPFTDGDNRNFSHYDETTLEIQLRYAPGEKFYQNRSYRYPINLDAPVFLLSHTFAPKGIAGNMFAINRTEISIQKRIWFSAFGYLDGIIKGGWVWSRSPYPNLLIPNANLSYTIQPESFALMNPMEFINDRYMSWDITYWANGAIFNYIPYFKKLKLREAFSFRGLFGKLSDRNNPDLNNELFRFPSDAHTRPMDHGPYMEIGVGIDNIIKILRVDYVWRLSYRDTYHCDRSGLRIALHFTF